MLVTAILNLQGAAGATAGHRVLDLQEVFGSEPGGHRLLGIEHGQGCVPGEPLGDGFDEAGFVAVADDEAGAGCGQITGTALGVAAGGHDEGVRLPPAGAAHRATGIGIAGTGDRARVDDIDVRLLVEGDDLVTATLEPGAEGFGLVMVQLAAKVLDGHPQRGRTVTRRRRGVAHRKIGGGLVRKAGRSRQNRAERPVAEGDGRATEKLWDAPNRRKRPACARRL